MPAVFRKEKSVVLKGSASALSNNLSVFADTPKSTLYYAVVHRYTVNLVNASVDGSVVNHRTVVCKEPSAAHGTNIIQASLVAMPNRLILVMTSQTGIQMYDAGTAQLLYWYALGDMNKTENFGRGICGVQDDMICVGTHEGQILIFDIPDRGSNFTLNSCVLRGHEEAICDLQSEGSRLASSDDGGNIIIWKLGRDGFEQVSSMSGFGYPCTSLALWNGLVIGGYGSGHVRVYNAKKGSLCAEVAAHSKWINAIDVAKSSGMLLSAGEDSFVRLWRLSTDSPEIEHVHNECVADVQLQGAKFITTDGRAFGCTGYDSNEIYFFRTTA